MLTAEETSAHLIDHARKRARDPGFVWGIPYGFPGLDRATGGIHSGELSILMARPGVGKSTFAGEIAQHVGDYILQERKGKRAEFWANKVVRIVSMEMSASEWQQRMVCARARVPGEKVRTGFISPDELARFEQAAREVGELPIEYLDEAGSLEQVADFIRGERRCVYWVADHLGILPGALGGENASASLTRTIEKLRGLANRTAPGMVLTQMSRSVESRTDKRPMMSDIYGSGMAEAAAQLVLGLYRDDLYTQLSDDERAKPLPAECLILKNRHGPLGTVRFVFAHSLPKWLDTTEVVEGLTR